MHQVHELMDINVNGLLSLATQFGGAEKIQAFQYEKPSPSVSDELVGIFYSYIDEFDLKRLGGQAMASTKCCATGTCAPLPSC